MARRPKRLAFLQRWGSYSNETLVIVGATKGEIIAFMKRLDVKEEIIARFERNGPTDDDADQLAYVWNPPGTGVTLLYFKDWVNDWDHWDTLLHETNHLIHHVLVKSKGMHEEPEAQAYQQEFLFRTIRRKLWMLTSTTEKDKKHFKKLLNGD